MKATFIVLFAPLVASVTLAYAQEQLTVPCGITLAADSERINFHFATFDVGMADFSGLSDGDISVGIEMSVIGSIVSFSQTIEVFYEKQGSTFVYGGDSEPYKMSLMEGDKEKIGSFAEVSCSVTGYSK